MVYKRIGFQKDTQALSVISHLYTIQMVAGNPGDFVYLVCTAVQAKKSTRQWTVGLASYRHLIGGSCLYSRMETSTPVDVLVCMCTLGKFSPY